MTGPIEKRCDECGHVLASTVKTDHLSGRVTMVWNCPNVECFARPKEEPFKRPRGRGRQYASVGLREGLFGDGDADQ